MQKHPITRANKDSYFSNTYFASNIGKRTVRFQTRTTVLLLMLLFVCGCSPSDWQRIQPVSQEPTVDSIPVYPGATDIKYGSRNTGEVDPARTITFQSTDKPDNIKQFYQSTPTQQGWEQDQVSQTNGDGIYFSWPTELSRSAYTLDITFQSRQPGVIEVTIILNTYRPE
jgi:hypothetical protein